MHYPDTLFSLISKINTTGAGQPYPANYMTLPMNAAAQMTQSYIQHPQTPHDYYMQQQLQQQQQDQAQSNYANPSQVYHFIPSSCRKS